MKKILAVFFVLFCLLFSFLNVNAISWSDFKAFIVSKKELSETVKWKQYIYKMDQILNKVSNNKEALDNLQIKIEWLKEKFKDNNSNEVKIVKNIINYLYWKTLISIWKLEKENNIINNTIDYSVEDNIISYIKIENWNNLVFDLISWDKFKYVIYMDEKPISNSTSAITWQTDYLWWLKKRGNEWIYNLSKYFNWKYYFEIKAYRKTWDSYSYKFVTSYKKEMNLTSWVIHIEGNKLDSIKVAVSKKEINLWESIDLSYIWYNKDWTKYIVEEAYEMVDIRSVDNNTFSGGWFRIYKWFFTGEYKNLKLTKAGLSKIKVCQNYLCWYVEVNVIDLNKEQVSDTISLTFDWFNKIIWDNNEKVDWYNLEIKVLTDWSKSIKKKLGLDSNSFNLTNDYYWNYTNDLYWEDLFITIIWYTWKNWIFDTTSTWEYKEILKWELLINNFFEKADLSNINNYCSVSFEWVKFNLDNCILDKTIIDWSGDIVETINIIPSDLSKSYSFSANISPIWLPQYSFIWGWNWAASWIKKIDFTIKDENIDIWKYVWYKSIFIKDNESWVTKEMRIGLKLNIK